MSYQGTIRNFQQSHRAKSEILALISSTLIFFAIKSIWAYLYMPGPTVFGDELLLLRNVLSIVELKPYFTRLCPPGYPLLLTPAFFFDNWYEVMGVLNAFWSSLLLPATWLLARSIGLRNPLLAVILVACIPMHAIYPHYILSENVFVTFFVFAMALALRGGKSGKLESCLFGVVMGMTHMTKFLFLPAVPLFYLLWYINHLRLRKDHSLRDSHSKLNIFYSIVPYFLVIGAWVAYAYASGFTFPGIFGFGISGIKVADISKDSTVMWSTAYASYLVIAWYPLLIPITTWLTQTDRSEVKNIYQSSIKFYFVVTTILLVGGYWLLCVQHSLGMSYNHPVPQYILGRYLMHLTPIIAVLAILTLERLEFFSSRLSFGKLFVGLSVLTLALLASWWILFQQGIWEFPAYFAKIRFNAVGLGELDSHFVIFISIISTLLAFLLLRFFPKIATKTISIILALLLLQNTLLSAKEMKNNSSGRHAKELAAVWPFPEDQEKLVVVNITGMSKSPIESGLKFFGIPEDSFTIEIQNKDMNILHANSNHHQFLLVTSNRLHIEPMHSYEVGRSKYYIYEIDEDKKKDFMPQILSYGPKLVEAGEEFNVQPSGESALWMQISRSFSDVTIFWDNNPLPTLHTDDTIITATVPSHLTEIPHTAALTIHDNSTQLSSSPVSIVVRPPKK